MPHSTAHTAGHAPASSQPPIRPPRSNPTQPRPPSYHHPRSHLLKQLQREHPLAPQPAAELHRVPKVLQILRQLQVVVQPAAPRCAAPLLLPLRHRHCRLRRSHRRRSSSGAGRARWWCRGRGRCRGAGGSRYTSGRGRCPGAPQPVLQVCQVAHRVLHALLRGMDLGESAGAGRLVATCAASSCVARQSVRRAHAELACTARPGAPHLLVRHRQLLLQAGDLLLQVPLHAVAGNRVEQRHQLVVRQRHRPQRRVQVQPRPPLQELDVPLDHVHGAGGTRQGTRPLRGAAGALPELPMARGGPAAEPGRQSPLQAGCHHGEAGRGLGRFSSSRRDGPMSPDPAKPRNPRMRRC